MKKYRGDFFFFEYRFSSATTMNFSVKTLKFSGYYLFFRRKLEKRDWGRGLGLAYS